MNHRDNAVKLLDHYITTLMERPGTRILTVDNDTHAEVAQIVDEIIDAAVDKIRVTDKAIREGL